MSRRLFGYANLLESLARNPDSAPGRPRTCADTRDMLRTVALLRSLTADEASALLATAQLPARLETISAAVGVTVAECEGRLTSVAHLLTEGLKSTDDE